MEYGDLETGSKYLGLRKGAGGVHDVLSWSGETAYMYKMPRLHSSFVFFSISVHHALFFRLHIT